MDSEEFSMSEYIRRVATYLILMYWGLILLYFLIRHVELRAQVAHLATPAVVQPKSTAGREKGEKGNG